MEILRNDPDFRCAPLAPLANSFGYGKPLIAIATGNGMTAEIAVQAR